MRSLEMGNLGSEDDIGEVEMANGNGILPHAMTGE